MTKLTKNLILLISALIITCQSGFCYVLTSNELNQILADKLRKEAIKKLNADTETEIKINITNIPFSSLQIQTTKPKIEINPVSLIQENTFRRITIKNPDNTVIKAFNVNVETSVLKDVLVATKTISFNEEINSKNAQIKKANVLKNYNKVLSSFENDLIAKRNYQKGSVIVKDYTKTKAQIAKNSPVEIVFLSKGIKIKLQGIALKEGNIGDTILVRSETYNKIYNAKVKSSNEVVVKI